MTDSTPALPGANADLLQMVGAMAQQIAAMERQIQLLQQQSSLLSDPRRFLFPAKITSANNFQEQANVGGTFGDFTDGRNNTAAGAATPLWLPASTAGPTVMMYEERDGDDHRYTPLMMLGTGVFVGLATTGGATGTSTTTPDYVYTATTINGETVGTGMAPTDGRRNGNFTAATRGMGYFPKAGPFVLVLAFEATATVVGCVPGGG